MNEVDNATPDTEAVDGFTDTVGETDIASPDPGIHPHLKPLDPEEYAKAQKEAREAEEKK